MRIIASAAESEKPACDFAREIGEKLRKDFYRKGHGGIKGKLKSLAIFVGGKSRACPMSATKNDPILSILSILFIFLSGFAPRRFSISLISRPAALRNPRPF